MGPDPRRLKEEKRSFKENVAHLISGSEKSRKKRAWVGRGARHKV